VGEAGHLSGLILAAGQGRRLAAGPKALLCYRNEYFIERLARIFHESGCSPIIAVLGSRADDILQTAQLGNVSAVLNSDWASGMASSFRRGIAALGDQETDILVSVVDQPDISTETIRRLRAEHRPGRITVPLFSQQPGHPVVLDPVLARKAAAMATGDVGARKFMQLHPQLVSYVDCSDIGSGLDIDTQEDLQSLAERLRQGEDPCGGVGIRV
jgi:nicotine blue oxidoreductase